MVDVPWYVCLHNACAHAPQAAMTYAPGRETFKKPSVCGVLVYLEKEMKHTLRAVPHLSVLVTAGLTTDSSSLFCHVISQLENGPYPPAKRCISPPIVKENAIFLWGIRFLLLLNCYEEYIPTRYPVLSFSHLSVHVTLGTERWCCMFPRPVKRELLFYILIIILPPSDCDWTAEHTDISALWHTVYMVWHK